MPPGTVDAHDVELIRTDGVFAEIAERDSLDALPETEFFEGFGEASTRLHKPQWGDVGHVTKFTIRLWKSQWICGQNVRTKRAGAGTAPALSPSLRTAGLRFPPVLQRSDGLGRTLHDQTGTRG